MNWFESQRSELNRRLCSERTLDQDRLGRRLWVVITTHYAADY
jgi:hypothetical protein